MNRSLHMLAKMIGCPIGERIICTGPISYDEDGYPDYIGTPYWNGVDLAVKRQDPDMEDHEILHELGHWFVASDAQRKEPEFGLGYADLPLQQQTQNSVPLEEGNLQEALTQIFCVVVGSQLGIPSRLRNYEPAKSWATYKVAKQQEWTLLDWGLLFEEWAPIFTQLVGSTFSGHSRVD